MPFKYPPNLFDDPLDAYDPKTDAVNQAWFRADGGGTETEREELREILLNSGRLFGNLTRLLVERYQAATRKEIDFSQPNWQERQLFLAGYKKALQDVYRLVPKPLTKDDEGELLEPPLVPPQPAPPIP